MKIGFPIIKILTYFYHILYKSKLNCHYPWGNFEVRGFSIFKYHLKYARYNLWQISSQDRSSETMNLEDNILIINHHLRPRTLTRSHIWVNDNLISNVYMLLYF